MGKTLVNIVTEDNPIPAYLFVKEMYEEGDFLLLISAKDTEDDLDHLSEIVGVPQRNIIEIVLKNDIDEFRYELICRTLRNKLSSECRYFVNLAGGTRYMALAVQQAFEDYNSCFYYVNVEDNQIIQSKFDDSIYNDDDYGFGIRHRMNVTEYLDIHDMEHDTKRENLQPIFPLEMARTMLELFTKGGLNQGDFKILEMLRNTYRNCHYVNFHEFENRMSKNSKYVPKIEKLLDRIGLTPKGDNILVREEVEWLTGGWFEEYIYYIVKEAIQPDDIVRGIHIWDEKAYRRRNELDVTFIKNNKLFVIECKTGIETERMFNEIVYKVCALRESLLGISCTSYIFTLKEDAKDTLTPLAESMDIKLVDKDILLNENLLALEWARIKQIACV